jgi:hypothetical protein
MKLLTCFGGKVLEVLCSGAIEKYRKLRSVVLENSNVAKLESTQYLSVHSLPQEDRYDTDDASTRAIYSMLVP